MERHRWSGSLNVILILETVSNLRQRAANYNKRVVRTLNAQIILCERTGLLEPSLFACPFSGLPSNHNVTFQDAYRRCGVTVWRWDSAIHIGCVRFCSWLAQGPELFYLHYSRHKSPLVEKNISKIRYLVDIRWCNGVSKLPEINQTNKQEKQLYEIGLNPIYVRCCRKFTGGVLLVLPIVECWNTSKVRFKTNMKQTRYSNHLLETKSRHWLRKAEIWCWDQNRNRHEKEHGDKFKTVGYTGIIIIKRKTLTL